MSIQGTIAILDEARKRIQAQTSNTAQESGTIHELGGMIQVLEGIIRQQQVPAENFRDFTKDNPAAPKMTPRGGVDMLQPKAPLGGYTKDVPPRGVVPQKDPANRDPHEDDNL